MSLWQVTLQVFQECRNAPEKHSRVPMVIAGGDIFFRKLQLGFLGETPDGEHREASGGQIFARAFDVTETRLRPCGRDAQHDHAPSLASHVKGCTDELSIALRLCDVMIRRKYSEQRIAARGV